MKHSIRYICLLSILLLDAFGVRADGVVKVITLLEGVESATGGRAATRVADGICTLTLTPVTGYLVTADDIKAVKVIASDQAQARGQVPAIAEPLMLTSVDVSNLFGTTVYSFEMPDDAYDVEVTVNFRPTPLRAYPLWVKGIQVNDFNKDNVLGDKSAAVRFNPAKSMLALYGANVEIADTTSFVRSALAEGLTVSLRGNTTLSFFNGFKSMIQGKALPLLFVTDDANPGQMSWEMPSDGVFSEGFSIACEMPLELQPSGNLISKTPVTEYGLTVGSTVVNSVNCTDILGNGTMKYIETKHTLVLSDATITQQRITSSLDSLSIYLAGTSTISGTENLIVSTVPNATIIFTTAPNTPGKLTLIKSKNEGTWLQNFADPKCEQSLSELEKNEGQWIIGTAIKPLVDENNVSVDENVGENVQEGDDLSNTVKNDVLYNLKNEDDGYDDSDGVPGIVLASVMAEDEMGDIQDFTPGTEEFAEKFSGMTFQLPAGTGHIRIVAMTGDHAVLAVKIGNDEPVLLSGLLDYEERLIPYACGELTNVYVYSLDTATPASARHVAVHRGKVLTGHVKVTTLGVSTSSRISDNDYSDQKNMVMRQVKLYTLPETAVSDDGKGIVLSAISVPKNVDASRAVEDEPQETEELRITELAAGLFDTLNKDEILYVDLKGTALEDFTVNRSSGLMSGFGSNALFYLPAGNDDGGEQNVILGDSCSNLSLTDSLSFRSPLPFTAKKAILDRAFTPDVASTLLLPFALSYEQAQSLGTFHAFREVNGADAVFAPAESNGLAANVPSLFVPVAEKVEVSDVDVVATEAFTYTAGSLVGTYRPLAWDVVSADSYVLVDNHFVRTDASTSIGAFSAYLKAENAPAVLNLVINGEQPNGISTLSSADAFVCFDLQGRSVHSVTGQPIKPGVYIRSGKKVIIK